MKKILTLVKYLKPANLIEKLYRLHKESSIATKIVGFAYFLLLSLLLYKGVINKNDFIEIFKIFLK